MAVGLRVRNNGNILQIDGTYQNTELLASGSVTLNQSDVSGRGWYTTISFSGTLPMIAFRSPSPGVYWKMLGGNTIQVFAGQPTNTTPPTIQFYIFGTPSQASNIGGVGFVVRSDTTGQVIYNSNRKYLRILQAFAGDINPDAAISYAFPGKTVAIVQNMRPTRVQVLTGGPPQQPIFVVSQYSGCMYTPDAGTAVVINRQVASFTGFGGTVPSIDNLLSANYFVVDVTGY